MATLTLYQEFDFRVSQDRLWLVTDITASNVRMESGQYLQTMDGSFSYDPVTTEFSGISSSASLFINNAQVYRVEGLNHDAWQIALYAGNPGQTQNLYGYVFNGNDTITGSAGKDGLLGYGGNDRLFGGGGDDALIGGAANDMLDGQAGIDTAIFSGNRSAYTVTRTATGFTVTDTRGADGSDTLAGVERMVFADKTIALDVDADGVAGQAYRLYQAAFNRTPDAGGVGYWMSVMDKGASLESVAAGFVSSKEYADAYGTNLSHEQVVTKYYQNILHRAPEQAGLDYWTDVLDKGAALAAVLGAISSSQENIDGTAAIIGTGFEYTPYG